MPTGFNQYGRRIALAVALTVAAASTAASAQNNAQKHAKARPGEFKVASLTPASAPLAGDTVSAAEADMPAVSLSPEDSALLETMLADDAFRFDRDGPAAHLRVSSLFAPKALDVARTDRPDGSGTVVIKQPLATEWDAKIGADLGLAANPSNGFTPDNPLHVVRDDAGSGAAWASLNVPRLATIDARLDPTNDQGRLGTTFTRSLPLGREFAVTLQSQASVTETYGQPQAATPDIPLAVAPATTAAEPDPHVWSNVNTAKFDILSTGTTLAANLSSTSNDPVTHNTLSAEQKLYGALRITTAVTDIGQDYESKSISARVKLTW